ncbi:Transposase InsH for insertion sequence element IS5H [Pseudomonas synxantha]|nr:Transposase InsH for insertion sequence element IS5H [Pseudomonas synxantha]
MPWSGLLALIESYYPKAGGGCKPYPLAARRSTYSRLSKRGVLCKAKRKIEYLKAQTRAKVEHPFRVIKRQFGCVKVRFRGLMKNTAQLTALFALSNSWMVRKKLLFGLWKCLV